MHYGAEKENIYIFDWICALWAKKLFYVCVCVCVCNYIAEKNDKW